MQGTPKNLTDALEAASAGGVLESTSSFTLNPAEALRKSGSFQLPEPELWLVKVVQAAVAAGAESLDVRLESACVRISVSGGEFPGAAELARRVSFQSNEASQGHLLTGLRVLAVEEGTGFVLRTWNPQPETVVVNESRVPQAYIDEEVDEGLTLSLIVYRKGSITVDARSFLAEVPMKNLVASRAAEYLALVRRCWACPVPVTIDKKLLETRFYRATEGLTEVNLTSNFPTSVACGPTPVFQGRPKLAMRRPENLGEEELPGLYLAKRIYRDTHFLVRDPQREAGAFLDIQMGTKDLVAFFVCDGAIVASHRVRLEVPSFRRFPPWVGLRLYLQVTAAELDLSEFQVRDAPRLATQAFQASFGTFLELWHDLQEYQSRISIRRLGLESKQRGAERVMGALGGGVGLVAGCATGSIPIAFFLGGYLAGVGGWGADINQYIYGHVYGRMLLRGQVRPVLRDSLLYWSSLLKQQGDCAWRHADSFSTLAELTELSLSSFRVTSPAGRGGWAVKLVQAGVASSASRIDFSFGTEVVEIELHGVHRLSAPAQTYLAQALTGLAREGLAEIVLITGDGLTRWTPESVSYAGDCGGEFRLQLVFPKSKGSLVERVQRRIRGGCRLTIESTKYLAEYAWVSPVEIRLDKRILQTRYEGKRTLCEVYVDHTERGLPLGLLRAVLPPSEDGPLLDLPASHVVRPPNAAREGRLDYVEAKMKLPDTFSYWGPEMEGPCGGIVTITGDLRANSAVEFVLDGAIVDVQPLYLAQDFILQEKVMSGIRVFQRLQSPRVGLRCQVPVRAVDMVDQRVKEPLKKARAFLFAVAPLLKELVPELLQVFAHLRYSVSLKEIESWVKGKGHMDRSIALGDAFREQKFLRLFHSKELKKGLEDLDSYLSQLTDPGGLLSDHFDNPNLVQ